MKRWDAQVADDESLTRTLRQHFAESGGTLGGRARVGKAATGAADLDARREPGPERVSDGFQADGSLGQPRERLGRNVDDTDLAQDVDFFDEANDAGLVEPVIAVLAGFGCAHSATAAWVFASADPVRAAPDVGGTPTGRRRRWSTFSGSETWGEPHAYVGDRDRARGRVRAVLIVQPAVEVRAGPASHRVEGSVLALGELGQLGEPSTPRRRDAGRGEHALRTWPCSWAASAWRRPTRAALLDARSRCGGRSPCSSTRWRRQRRCPPRDRPGS